MLAKHQGASSNINPSPSLQIVPLLIVGLEEEAEELRVAAETMWREGGENWLQENKVAKCQTVYFSLK